MPAPATPVAAVGVAATRSPYWRSGCRQRKVYGESFVTVRLISNFISKSVMKYYVLLRARDDVTSDMYGTNTQIVQRRTASPEIVKPVRDELA